MIAVIFIPAISMHSFCVYPPPTQTDMCANTHTDNYILGGTLIVTKLNRSSKEVNWANAYYSGLFGE